MKTKLYTFLTLAATACAPLPAAVVPIYWDTADGSIESGPTYLQEILDLTPTDGGIIVGTGSGWTLETGATARTSLGLGAADSVSFSALTTQGDATIGGDLLLGIGGGQNVTVSPPATSTERTYTLPDASGTLLLSDETQTLTNKTIDGDDNTLQDIPQAAVTDLPSALSRRAFAGGVYYEAAGEHTFAGGTFDFGTSDFSLVFALALDDWTPATAGELLSTHSSGDNRVVLSIQTDGDWRLSITDSGSSTTDYDITPSATLTDGEQYAIAIVADRDGDATLYIDGEASGTVDISGSSAVDMGDSNANPGEWMTDANLTGAACGLATLNVALAAADAETIAVAGYGYWSATRPEYVVGFGDAAVGFANDYRKLSGTGTLSSLTPTSFVIDASASNISADLGTKKQIDARLRVGEVVNVTMTISGLDGTVNASLRDEGGYGSISGSVNMANGTATYPFTLTAAGRPWIYFQNFSSTSGGSIAINSITVSGTVVHLPMDEGVGYQLRDLTANSNDALLSTTGLEHLIPKKQGSVRDFALDANGATADIIDGSRDILPAGAIIERAIIRNNDAGNIASAAFGLNRTDGSNTAEIGDNAHQIDDGDAGLIFPDLTQDLADLRLEVPDTSDGGMDDFDIEAFYTILP